MAFPAQSSAHHRQASDTDKFEARIRELVADHPDLAAIVEPLLIARSVLRQQPGVLHRQLLEIVRHDEVCRRLMTTLASVVAQGLGHEDCPASWHEARDRRCGATAGGHHASHVGG